MTGGSVDYIDRSMEDLYRLTSDTFDAALVVSLATNKVVAASPLIHYMYGAQSGEVRNIAAERGWTLKHVPYRGYEDEYQHALSLLRKARLL